MGELGNRLAEGDERALAEFYDACSDRLHHYLTVRLQSREEADEALQETFVRLARSRRRLARVKSPIAYAYVVARNEAARLARQRGRLRARRVELDAAALFCEAAGEGSAQRETAEVIAAALARLSRAQREVVELKIYSGLTFREIAEVTGVRQGTAAARYRKALARLRPWLAGEME